MSGRAAGIANRTGFCGDPSLPVSEHMYVRCKVFSCQSYQNVSRETFLTDWTPESDKTDASYLTPRRHDEIDLIHLAEGILP